MIHDFDRSWYIGGSDMRYVMSNNRTTVSWTDWWNEKIGEGERRISSQAMKAGTIYEPFILDAIDPEIIHDGQIIYDRYRLRINYDGWKQGNIVEVKTYQYGDKWEKPAENAKGKFKEYWWQCQIQMYVYTKLADEWFLPPFESLYLASYPLFPDERNKVEWGDQVTVDPDRIHLEEIEYNEDWVKNVCLPRVKELARALKKTMRKKGIHEADIQQESESDTDITEDEAESL